jgi:site-specific recombinase XerD
MLTDIILRPCFRQRYWDLPILGSEVDEFSEFLRERGYFKLAAQRRIRGLPLVEKRLKRQGCRRITDITPEILHRCGPPIGKAYEDVEAGPTVRLLSQYFYLRGRFERNPPGPIDKKLIEYGKYLESVRGFAPATVCNHQMTSREFLSWVCAEGRLSKLKHLTAQDLEEFVRIASKRMGRGSLQHIVARTRALLKYLASRGEAPQGLDLQIDTARVYRGEKLPKALPWKTVQNLLGSIDRSSPKGKRDYAMLLLISTYGLRSSEVAGLKLDDIDWRNDRILVFQRKTIAPLLLPLTDGVGKAILAYVKNGRPEISYRQIFVRHRAPSGILKPACVSDVFQAWASRSGLEIPYQGAHCLRHSYAVHLLRQGTSVKTIGDVLGHRTLESTCVYLRLSVEDLRSVPLSLPRATTMRRAH